MQPCLLHSAGHLKISFFSNQVATIYLNIYLTLYLKAMYIWNQLMILKFKGEFSLIFFSSAGN